MVNEETARHPRGNLLNNRERLFAEDQRAQLFLFMLPHKPIPFMENLKMNFIIFPPPVKFGKCKSCACGRGTPRKKQTESSAPFLEAEPV